MYRFYTSLLPRRFKQRHWYSCDSRSAQAEPFTSRFYCLTRIEPDEECSQPTASRTWKKQKTWFSPGLCSSPRWLEHVLMKWTNHLSDLSIKGLCLGSRQNRGGSGVLARVRGQSVGRERRNRLLTMSAYVIFLATNVCPLRIFRCSSKKTRN